MRRFWTAAAMLALLLGLSLCNGWYAQALTGRMGEDLSQAKALAGQGRWDLAEKITRQVYADWQGHHFYLHTVMRHGDTDQVIRSFQQVLEYLRVREIDQYNAAAADLTIQLALLAEMEQASLANVL